MGDRSALRREMLRVDGGIDTQVDVPCDACGARIRARRGEPSTLAPYSREALSRNAATCAAAL